MGWTAIVAASVGATYAVLSTLALRKIFCGAGAELPAFPPVTLLKPLCGAERDLLVNLEGFFLQDYPAPIQFIFGTHTADDPAIGIINALRVKYPDADISLVVNPRLDNCNPKVTNLIGMFPATKHDVVVLSDSDISVPPNYLREVVVALNAPHVGAVSCLYAGRPLRDLWSRLSAMGINYQFLPGVAFALATGLAEPCFGSTIGIKTSVLREIGGFEPFRQLLADDYEIGRAVRARGYRLAYPPIIVNHACVEENARELFRHELRWARTIRSIQLTGHAGSVATHVLPLGLLGVGLLAFSTPALLIFGVIVAARVFQKLQVDRILKHAGQPICLLLRRDILSFVVFACSFFTRRVSWRGSRYRVDAHGALAPD
jgi:ceramide glucosyltransferase